MKDDIANIASFYILPLMIYPELSDESAHEIFEYLKGMTEAFEIHYFDQIMRYADPLENRNDLMAQHDFEVDNDPPF